VKETIMTATADGRITEVALAAITCMGTLSASAENVAVTAVLATLATPYDVDSPGVKVGP
jgi:hypothetical protein